MDQAGKVIAQIIGIALIATGFSGCDTVTADTSMVSPSGQRFLVSPATVSLEIGQSVTPTVAVTNRGGQPINLSTITWLSSDTMIATVHSNGEIKGKNPGVTTVSAKSGQGSGQMSVEIRRTNVGSDTDGPTRANEPSGYVPWLEHDFSYFPNDGNRIAASGTGYIFPDGNLPNYSVVDDPSAPHGTGHSLRIRYPDGMRSGVTPGRFFGRDKDADLSDATGLKSWYISMWVQYEGSTWEVPPAAIKLWYNRSAGGSRDGGMTLGSGDAPNSLVDQWGSWRFWYYEDETSSHATASVSPGPRVGEWFLIEQLVETEGSNERALNGANFGRVQTWINGELVQSAEMKIWLEGPFQEFHWAPVWGGNCADGCPKTRDDYLRVGALYVSGIPGS